MKRGVTSSEREVIALLYSTIMRTHLKYYVQVWDPRTEKMLSC